MENARERVILVGVQTTQSDEFFEYELSELAQLTETALGEVVGVLTQKRERTDSATIIGKGKVEELVNLCAELEADTVIFHHGLTARQVRNIQETVDCKVIDRVQLILDIFAMRARSKEGKLQVALAQLDYLLPRLSGQGVNLSRLGGGIGTRGPGETKLETDRRHIRSQMQEIKKTLEETEKHRERAREKRRASEVFQIGLIGYTNAGKSTIINRLTDAKTYEENQLFATLDPLTRKLTLPNQFQATITDTVGFIQDLPTQLIHAFHSTLEESRNMDVFLHVVDASTSYIDQHEATVLKLLKDLDMDKTPMLTIYNKIDLASPDFQPRLYPNIMISAIDEDDIGRLKDFLWEEIAKMLVPYTRDISASGAEGNTLNKMQQETFVESIEYIEESNVYRLRGYAKRNSKWLGDVSTHASDE
ncbi:gtpase hflx [Trichococcus palustris]|jgi:GTPase|uniref:GTPase HflX n=1 Tax=Trichococcus palustris TaxID=140314 RepID=A0A143YCE9_9LACT|nr:GTPase HflX [Trichococcus palustris]CZQ87391.1 gtpase hflx [Trichococcus palustris]SFK79043.1 GTP-binding protein HflX [Trichococcus palustris]